MIFLHPAILKGTSIRHLRPGADWMMRLPWPGYKQLRLGDLGDGRDGAGGRGGDVGLLWFTMVYFVCFM
jgi:hypothetical protein